MFRAFTTNLKVSCLLIMILFAFMAPFTTPIVHAADALAFQDGRASEYTWEQIEKGIYTAVYYTGKTEGIKLWVEAVGFGFKRDGVPLLNDHDVLNVRHDGTVLVPGKPIRVFVKALENAKLKPGVYKGLLVVSCSEGSAVRKELAIVVPGGAIKVLTGENISLTATRNPFTGIASLDHDELLIEPLIWDEQDLSGGLGWVTNDGKPGRIEVAESLKDSVDGVTRLPLRFNAYGRAYPGLYSGKLEAAVSGNDKKEVGVKVIVTDHIFFAIGAILIGVLITLLSTLYLQRWRPSRSLKKRRDTIKDKYRSIIEITNNNKELLNNYMPDEKSIYNYLDSGFDSARKAYLNQNLIYEKNGEDYKKLTGLLDAAEEDIRLYGNISGNQDANRENIEKSELKMVLVKLVSEIEKVNQFLNRYKKCPVPEFKYIVESMKNGEPLGIGEPKQIIHKATAYIRLMKHWLDLAELTEKYKYWCVLITNMVHGMGVREKCLYFRTLSLIKKAEKNLTRADDAEVLLASGVRESLDSASGTLYYLAGLYSIPEPDEGEVEYVESSAEEKGVAAEYCFKEMETSNFIDIFKESALDLLKALGIRPLTHKQLEFMGNFMNFLGEIGVVAISFAVALFTGLSQFYFGKPFGTFQDYLSVILLGVGSQAVFKSILETLKQLRKS